METFLLQFLIFFGQVLNIWYFAFDFDIHFLDGLILYGNHFFPDLQLIMSFDYLFQIFPRVLGFDFVS